MHPDLARLD
jgi:hypothetical protein